MSGDSGVVPDAPDLPSRIEIFEVGPREGFQFEGIGDPERISSDAKLRLIASLAETGLQRIQVASFVHPRLVPQMADAEMICSALPHVPGVVYSAVYLNDVGLRRARAADNIEVSGKLTLTASETFAKKNQNRTLAEDLQMQRAMAADYQAAGIAVTSGSIMAAFGCNYEGDVPLDRVLDLTQELIEVAREVDGRLDTLTLADTMGWAQPVQVQAVVGAIRSAWPDLRIGLHLHDTRGLGMANAYAALTLGVDLFDTSVGGLGGCPFAGHRGAAGNIATEELVFLCTKLGIETGVSLDAIVESARLAADVVGHPVASRLALSGAGLHA